MLRYVCSLVLCLLLSTALTFRAPTTTSRSPPPSMKQRSTKGGKKNAAPSGKGFGSTPVAKSPPPAKEGSRSSPNPSKAFSTSSTTADARRVDIDLGRGKSIAVMLPSLDDDPDEAALESLSTTELQDKFGQLTGAGDIVWPAGLALTRMLAHCPSFVADKTVLELGSGLGAVGLTAAQAGAKSVVLTDYDADVLALAAAGAQQNGVDARVATERLDWSLASARTPDGGPFDVVVGADILYDRDNAHNIARLLPQLLSAEDARCFIADQTQWPWRAEFEAVCAKGGLAVAQVPLPGAEDVQLLSIQKATTGED